MHVARPTESFEEPNHAGGNIDLSRVDAVSGGSWERVMSVVPRLAETEQRQR
jgi:hypothetical protein